MRVKYLWFMVLCTINVFAVSQQSVEYYVKQYIENKMHSPVEKVETLSHYMVGGTQGWEAYFLNLEVKIKMGKVYRIKSVSQVVFTKGKQIAFSLKDKKGRDYAKILKPKVPQEAYDDEHLLVGNKNATHKILVFSDPFCPFCQEIVPQIIKSVQDNPDKFALYYYHLPLLRIHPASSVVTKAMYIFQKQGKLKELVDMYHLLVSERERNEAVILQAIKNKTGITLTSEQINAPEIQEALAFDNAMKKRLMVTGTPTIFIDGIWDPTRKAYKKYLH